MVSRPIYVGGLGFGLKWNMGWMHDTLDYFRNDPVHRKYHHDRLTFSIWYAFTENFVLALSHDEVVHGKGSLIGKMPGDSWRQFANLRLLFGYMWGHPGKKLLFMGGEFGQRREWQHEESLEWHVLQYPLHRGVRQWMRDLNAFYKTTPAMYQRDFTPDGFEWIDQFQTAAGDIFQNQAACRFHAAVQVNGGDQRLQGIGNQRPFVTPAAQLFAPSEAKKPSELQTVSGFVQVIGADQVGFQPRQLSFPVLRETPHQLFTDHKP